MAHAHRAREPRQVVKASDGEKPFVTREIAGETIIVPVRDSVVDLNAIYTLNEVGSRIWQLIDGPTAVDRIVRRLSEEYAVSADQAAEDVTAFLTDLQAAGLVRVTGGSGEA